MTASKQGNAVTDETPATEADDEFLTYVDGTPLEDVAGERVKFVRPERRLVRVNGSRPVRLNSAGFKLTERPGG